MGASVSTDRAPSSDLDRLAQPLLEFITSPGCADCRRFEVLFSRIQPDFPSLEARKTYGVFGLPTHYVIDRQGVIRDRAAQTRPDGAARQTHQPTVGETECRRSAAGMPATSHHPRHVVRGEPLS